MQKFFNLKKLYKKEEEAIALGGNAMSGDKARKRLRVPKTPPAILRYIES